MIKIGINGFGRIGRVILRILSQRPEEFEVCGDEPAQGRHRLYGLSAQV